MTELEQRLLPIEGEHQAVAEMRAAQAKAEIEALGFEARKHFNHVFGALIAWNRKRFKSLE